MSKDNIGDHSYKLFRKDSWQVTVTKDGNVEIWDRHAGRHIIILRHHVRVVGELISKALAHWKAGDTTGFDGSEAA